MLIIYIPSGRMFFTTIVSLGFMPNLSGLVVNDSIIIGAICLLGVIIIYTTIIIIINSSVVIRLIMTNFAIVTAKLVYVIAFFFVNWIVRIDNIISFICIIFGV